MHTEGRFKIQSFDGLSDAEDWLNSSENDDYELTKFTVRSHGSGVLYVAVVECVKRDMGPDVEGEILL